METKSTWIRQWIENYMTELECPVCHGSRLSDDVLAVQSVVKISMKQHALVSKDCMISLKK